MVLGNVIPIPDPGRTDDSSSAASVCKQLTHSSILSCWSGEIGNYLLISSKYSV